MATPAICVKQPPSISAAACVDLENRVVLAFVPFGCSRPLFLSALWLKVVFCRLVCISSLNAASSACQAASGFPRGFPLAGLALYHLEWAWGFPGTGTGVFHLN